MRPTESARARAHGAIIISVLTITLLSSSTPVAAQEGAEELPATLKADSYTFDRQARILTARGNVVLSARDITIRADVLVADLQTRLITAEGNVRLEVAGQSVAAEMLTYSLASRTGTLFNAQTEYRSALVLGTVKLRAEELKGDLMRFVTIRNGFATTCEEPDPVVFARAEEVSIFANDKIVGRQVSLWVGGRRLFTVPYFIIFLRERRDTRIAPMVGYSDAEGWFVKTSWAYFINENHYGLVHADWFERLGVGTGIEHLYRTPEGEGSALLYRLANRQTGGTDLRAVSSHVQRMGDIAFRLFADYQELSAMAAPSTSFFFAAADLSVQTPQSSTYLFSTLSQSSAGPASVLTSQLAHAQILDPRLTSEVFLDYSQNVSPTGTDEELFPRLTLRYFGEGFTAALVAETRWDVDGDRFVGDDRYVLERLPELSLAMSPFRIGETNLVGQITGGVARYRETTVGIGGRILDSGRTNVQMMVSGPVPLAAGVIGVWTFARQTWYTTGDARGFYGGRVEYVRPLTHTLEGGVGYTGQSGVGASPFVFDQIGVTLSVADAQLTYRSPNLLLRATGFYDFQTKLFGNAVGQAIYQPRLGWTVGLAGSYNLDVGRLDRVEAAMDLQLSPEWRLEYSGAWDSVTQSVFNNRVSLTRTFCECLAASLSYLGAANEFWLEVWLTAIPWGRGKIGIGGQGTLLFEQPWWLQQH